VLVRPRLLKLVTHIVMASKVPAALARQGNDEADRLKHEASVIVAGKG
jgi:hypothetical protein